MDIELPTVRGERKIELLEAVKASERSGKDATEEGWWRSKEKREL